MLRKRILLGTVVLLLCTPLLWSQPVGTPPAAERVLGRGSLAQPTAPLVQAWRSVKIMFR